METHGLACVTWARFTPPTLSPWLESFFAGQRLIPNRYRLWKQPNSSSDQLLGLPRSIEWE
jgi:hypothetical protein